MMFGIMKNRALLIKFCAYDGCDCDLDDESEPKLKQKSYTFICTHKMGPFYYARKKV